MVGFSFFAPPPFSPTYHACPATSLVPGEIGRGTQKSHIFLKSVLFIHHHRFSVFARVFHSNCTLVGWMELCCSIHLYGFWLVGQTQERKEEIRQQKKLCVDILRFPINDEWNSVAIWISRCDRKIIINRTSKVSGCCCCSFSPECRHLA
jgi:hypothetical protein